MSNLLNRKQAADYLKSRGLKLSKQTLAIKAMSGKGPRYALIGRTAYYQQEWLDEWLDSQLKPSAHSFAHMLSKNGENNG